MVQKNILVSILINNYNNKLYIKKCIQSCIRQSYEKFEIIIYDDNSNDGSQEIIKNIKDKRIKKIFNKKKMYNTGALNQLEGIYRSTFKSKGDIIFLLDGDDFFLKDKLNYITKIFKKKNLNFVQDSPYYYFPGKNKKIKKKLRNKFFTMHTWPYFFPTSTMTFKRKFLIKLLKEIKFSKNKYSRMFFDGRAFIYMHFFDHNFLRLNHYLTMYNQNVKGDTIKNYSKKNLEWWKRRYEYHMYVSSLFKKKNKYHFKFLDYYVTVLINFLFK